MNDDSAPKKIKRNFLFLDIAIWLITSIIPGYLTFRFFPIYLAGPKTDNSFWSAMTGLLAFILWILITLVMIIVILFHIAASRRDNGLNK